ncbi:MAG: PAS domain S-box protein [Deltaproteobacteria bacterium]|nr:PAS domain S-box protein [Deltaproteobacteria bacterium]
MNGEMEYLRRQIESLKAEVLLLRKGNLASPQSSLSSHQKNAQTSLIQSEEKFRLIFQTSPDSISLNRLSDERYIDVNEGFTKLTGYTQEEALGKTPIDLNIWDSPGDGQCFVNNLLSQGSIENLEIRYRKKNLKVGIGLMSARVLSLNQEDVILSVIRDITERKQAEDTLRESEERHRQIVESSIDAILVRSSEFVIYANPAAVKLFRASHARELVGKRYLDLVHPDDRPESIERIKRGMNEKWIAPPREHRISALDGQAIIVESTGVPVQYQGETQNFAVFRDISGRKKAEEDLRHQFAFLQQLVNAIPAPIFFKDVKGAYTGCNKAFEEFKGIRREEIIGKSVSDISPPELAGIYLQKDKELYDHGEPQMYEGQSLAADGTLRDIVFHKATLSGADGNTTGMVGVILDITERKRAEIAVQESGERYRALFANMLNGFAYCKMLFDDQGRPVDFVYLDVNQAFTRLTGLENVVGRKVSDVIPGIREMSPELLEIYGRIALTGKAEPFEIYFKPLASWLSVSAYSPQRYHFVAVFENITKRKKDETALRVSHRFLEIVHDHREMTPLLEAFLSEIKAYTGCEAVGIRILDEEGRIPYWACTGFSQEFFNLESPLSIKSNQCMCINVIKGTTDPALPFYTQGGSFYMSGTTRFLATVSEKDKGQTRNRCNQEGYESVALVPFRDGDRILGLIHVADRREGMVPLEVVEMLETAALQLGTTVKRLRADQDKEKLESRLQQAQKMESLGTLAGGIAHDFNNILGVIMGSAEMLDWTNAVASSSKDTLGNIITASQRAKDLVRQILAFSRHAKQEKILLNLKAIIKETFEFLRASLPSNIQLRQQIDPKAGNIMADPTQMQQILMNLGANAAHAMEKTGGVLQIHLSNVTFNQDDVRFDSDMEPGQYVRLDVTDTGHGIAPDVMNRIFDPYFTTKEKGKGTGLGLSVVHGIVKAHGGTIKVYSEIGIGTSFQILLPRAEGYDSTETKPLATPPGGKERILLVDDEKALADIEKQMLNWLGYDVEVRTSAVEALEAFRAKPESFDLVITDLTMPQMTGIKLVRQMIQIRPGVPIILCTGFSDQIDEKQAYSLGIKSFLLKPLVARDLAAAVRRALDA